MHTHEDCPVCRAISLNKPSSDEPDGFMFVLVVAIVLAIFGVGGCISNMIDASRLEKRLRQDQGTEFKTDMQGKSVEVYVDRQVKPAEAVK